MKFKKLNIGSTYIPKFTNIGDYWDDETIGKIMDLLHEFQDLFPTKFSDMKGIDRDLGEMKIPLKPIANLMKKKPYQLNLQYKEKLKMELDPILDVGIIEPVEECECISMIVVQDKNTMGEVHIFIDIRKLNDTCLQDLFPTPFTSED